MSITVESSAGGSHWYIKLDGVVIEGAPKRGHGSATRKQMIEWAADIRRGLEK